MVQAQVAPSIDPDEVINYPYLLHHELGTYQMADQRVNLVALPLRVSLRSFAADRMGLTLRLTAYFGAHKPTPTTLDQIRVTALVPGLELQIPIRDNLTFRPYQDFGAGKDREGGDLVWVSTTGLLTELVLPWKRFDLGVEPQVKYSFSYAPDREFDDSFGVVSLKLDTRHPLWFEIGDRVPSVGVYVTTDLYFDELTFPTMDTEPLTVDRQLELGLSFGVNPPGRLWILKLTRLSVGYHFSQGLNGVSIRFGDRRTQLPPR